MGNTPSRLQKAVSSARQGLADFIAPSLPSNDAATSANDSDVTQLRSLSPEFNESEHEGYVRVLVNQLTKDAASGPLNVALTGHYGSGKSSVLVETEKRLASSGVEVINLSLPSLGVGDGRLPKDGDPELDRTNLIQKEIVKQLLYRRKPTDTPASRYNRLDTFDSRAATQRGAAVALFVTLVALLAGLPARVDKAIPVVAWEWLDEKIFDHFSDTVQWLSLAVVFLLTMFTTTWIQRVLQQRLRVTELGAGAGPASVKLSEPTSSYFDEYLDEIVYYFQTSQTKVIIFEDLDRFKDPHIFETLRELNMLLNNAEQTGVEPIRFVYAIRDSIFEQLDAKPKPEKEEGAQQPAPALTDAEVAENKAETRRLITTNRTKFFDLVIPMVPFISHRTSRDLMTAELKAVPSRHRPSDDVVDLVSARITDMRLIKNICNEYDVFRTRILKDDGLQGLTPDRLFASVVYKNLYLLDYEKVRNGGSLLDEVYKAYRAWVAQLAGKERVAERRARVELRRVDGIARRSARLGERLQKVINARITIDYPTSRISVTVNGTNYNWADLRTTQFWRAYLESEDDLTIVYNVGQYPQESVALGFSKVEALIGESLDAEDWDARDRRELRDAISTANGKQLEYAHASLSFAINAADDEFVHDEVAQTLRTVAESRFADAPLVIDLLSAGHIDENFTLYVTQFPGDSSAAAMNFILKSVQPNVMDINYHFGATADVNESDIRAALAAESNRILNGQSVFNRELFDFLLATDPKKLSDPIRRLVLRADEDTEFIEAYIDAGKERDTFVRMLSARWPNIFSFLLGVDAEAESVDAAILSAALSGADPSISYELSDQQRDVLTSVLGDLAAVTTARPIAASQSLAEVLTQMGIRVSELESVARPLFVQLVARSLYLITLKNLQLIMGNGGLALDEIKHAGPVGVYDNLIANLQTYLEVIRVDPFIVSVRDKGRFAEVLKDVHETSPSLVGEVAQAAEDRCILDRHDEVEPTLWPAVLGASRFKLSVSNVAAYIDQHGFDEVLRSHLSESGSISTDGTAEEQLSLAIIVLKEANLSKKTRLQLVASLNLEPGAIAASELAGESDTLIPPLVVAGAIADDADAFLALDEESWDAKYELIRTSSEFASYMSTLSFSTGDLHVMTWPDSPASVKRTVLDNMSEYQAALGPKGATNLLKWAAANSHPVTADTLAVLAGTGKSAGAVAAIKLAGPLASSIDLVTLTNILSSLGGAYAQIASRGRDRPRVPDIDGIAAVLARLQSEDIVSKFDLDRKRSVYKVSKRL